MGALVMEVPGRTRRRPLRWDPRLAEMRESAACTYAMLIAETLGLGTTMIGGAAPILQRNPRLCRDLGIPTGHTPAIALILGYPATHFLRAVRRRFLDVRVVSSGADAGKR